MKNALKWIFVFGIVLSLVMAVSAEIKPITLTKSVCCIGGSYIGTNEDTPSGMCNNPQKGKFTMEITQIKDCGKNVKGIITDSSGAVMNFTGIVTTGPFKCCNIEGTASKPGESVTFKALMCKDRKGKWFSKNGTYKHSNGCEGKFQIYQQ